MQPHLDFDLFFSTSNIVFFNFEFCISRLRLLFCFDFEYCFCRLRMFFSISNFCYFDNSVRILDLVFAYVDSFIPFGITFVF